jgi:hypothetical protein
VKSFSHYSSPALWVIAAAACVVATWIPLVIGLVFDVFPLVWWGVVSAYLGISWLAPAAFLGVAAAERTKQGAKSHPKVLGVASGVGAGIVALTSMALLLAAFGAGTTDEEDVADEVLPAVSDHDERMSLVMSAARQKHSRFGRVDSVACGLEAESECVVTYHWPACQFWLVENVNGVDIARPLDAPSEGGRGTFREGKVGCQWE